MTRHEQCETARLVSCYCGALPGGDCACDLIGGRGVHLARFARCRARLPKKMSAPEFASVIADADVYTGTTIVLDSL